MSTIKNGKISLYCHFNKVIKGPDAFRHRPKNMSGMFVIHHTSILPNFILIVLIIQKEINITGVTYVAMHMMISQILKCGFHKITKI